MKKVIAIVLALATVLCLSVTAFAADSPSGEISYKIATINGVGGKGQPVQKKQGETVTMSADGSKGTFNSWSVYKADGKAATKDVDYEIVKGGLTEKEIEVKPKNDLIICGNYNGVYTDPLTGLAGNPISPKTGDMMVALAAVMMLAAVAGIFVSKKQFSK